MGIGEGYPNFEKLKEIGSGSYGIVYKIRDINNNKIYAIKEIEKKSIVRSHNK